MGARPRLIAVWALFAIQLNSVLASDSPASTFERDVRPILKEHCFHCHGEGDLREGDLDLRLRRWMVSGGISGPAVVPGDPDGSLLVERVVSGDMPPGDAQLAAEEIERLVAWIAAGAKTVRPEPESLEAGYHIAEEERNHWSFQPIRNPAPPQLQSVQVRNPIDAFLLRRLEREGLSFSDPADRPTLIRRAAFDLWGLPPDPQMVEEFVHDDRPFAYERLMDRLLASPRYGERWARHWLDVAGYADSEGYSERDAIRPFAYFYRDYVVDSLNASKPLDQFVREQLAGDELGADTASLTDQRIAQLAATGFLRMAPDGTADGSVDRDVAANDTIASTLEIVSSSLLGLTVGCARCHDHRYDPISQSDYYQFRAIFAPALDSKSWRVPDQRRISLYTSKQRELREQIEARANASIAARQKRQQEHIERTLEEELLVVPDEVRDTLRTAYQTSAAERSQRQQALLESYPSVGNISNGSLYLYAEQRARRAADIERVADEKERQSVRELRGQRIAEVTTQDADALREMLDLPREHWTEEQVTLAEQYPRALLTAADLESLLPERYEEIQRYREAARLCRQLDAKTELAEMQQAIDAIRAEAPPEHFLRALTEPPGHQPETHLFIRGDHNQPDRVMPPAELQVLEQVVPVDIVADDANLETSGRRLAYARQLTSGRHPLFARVLVNRVWLHHFGRGIVATPGDFGRLGASPTHPELLDWLATELMNSNWDLKHLHRLIMQSHAYRQRSTRTETLDRLDPDNRWYARQSIRRLESEAVRDAVLAVSGQLIDQLHGPPVPVKEDAVGQIVIGVEMLDGERKPTGEDRKLAGASRRSLYVQVRRTRPLAVLDTFDVPSNAPNCPQRNASNVATQSLMMMNSEFIVRHADQMASDLIERHEDAGAQLSAAWQRCFGREIEDQPLGELTQFLRTQAEAYVAQDASLNPADAHRLALASACQAMLGANGFLYVD